MKTKLLLGMLLLASCAPQHDEVRIEGQLKDVDDGMVIQLLSNEGGVGKYLMADTILDGKFRFAYTPEDDKLRNVMVVLRSDNFPSMPLELWVKKGCDVRISGKDRYIFTWDVESDIKEQQFRQKLIKASLNEWKEVQRLSIEGRKYYRAYAMKNDKKMRAMADSLYKMKDDITFNIIYKRGAKVMLDSDINAAWLDELEGLATMLRYEKDIPIREELQQLYEMLDEEQKKSDVGISVSLALNPPTIAVTGSDAPDGDIYDLEGNIHHISDFRGKFVLLDFWSDGCGFCIMALPELKAICDEYKDNLEVVSLNIQDKNGWKKVSEKHSVTWNNWNDLKGNNGLSAVYGVRGIPHFVMISPEGKILDSWSGYSKDYLKFKVRTIINTKRPPMSIRNVNRNKVVDFPRTKSSDYDVLSILQVKLTDKATILKVRATYIPHNWIRLDKNTSITSDSGLKCKLLKADGFKIDEKVFMPKSGTMDFILYFEPLPKDAKSFDLSEGADVEGGYEIKGVSLF